jgi:nucleoid-associated protein YgaU
MKELGVMTGMIRNSRCFQGRFAGHSESSKSWKVIGGVVFTLFVFALIAPGGCSESAATRERRRTTQEPETRERRLEVAGRSGDERSRPVTSRRASTTRRNPSNRANINPTPRGYREPAPNRNDRRSPLRKVEPPRTTNVEPAKRPPAVDPGPVASANDSYVPPPQNPPAPEPTVRVYHVQTGDTLWSLANRFYGDSKHWRRILAANRNRVPDPRNLPVGIKLIIP